MSKTGMPLITWAVCMLLLSLTTCDCQYHISGVVLDRLTRKPIADVAIGKTDTTDLNNPFNRKTFTNENGNYKIYGIAGNCDEVALYFTKENYETRLITLQNNSRDTIFLEPIFKPQTAVFDPEGEFEITQLIKSNDYPSSEKDTKNCSGWGLTKHELEIIVRESKQITGPEWHHSFDHLPCRIHGKLIQDLKEYVFSVNSGGWLTVSSVDTTFIYGSFKEENDRFFLSTALNDDPIMERE